jgi:hypothetical protein
MRAVFEPACRAGVFMESALPWEGLDRSCSADDLIALLLPLSEYYQEINPPLSTALWGIWNASRSFRRQRSVLSMLFERKRKDVSVFAEIRGWWLLRHFNSRMALHQPLSLPMPSRTTPGTARMQRQRLRLWHCWPKQSPDGNWS